MKRKVNLLAAFALAVCSLLCSVGAMAEPTPRWVRKGVKELNAKRLNDSYSFHIFHETDNNDAVFELDRFRPLLAYIDSVYGVKKTAITVDSIPAEGALPTTYQIHFIKDGQPETVYVRRVDEFSKFDTDMGGFDEYHFYQLYAISEPGVREPQFDRFTVTRRYNGNPVAMSLIPGLGQIYKGEPGKGYTFLGIEAAMVASIVYATTQVNANVRYAHEHPNFYDNYQSKAKTFRQWRLFCYITGGALYAYNLFDAAFAKGARYVKISRPNAAPQMQLSVVPFVSSNIYTQSYGLGFNLTF